MSIYVIHGSVRDKSGALAQRAVFSVRESDGTLDGTWSSDPVTGLYMIAVPNNDARTVVFSGEADRNALVFSGVLPAAATEILPTAFSQSSTYPSVTSANTTRMRDGNYATGTGTNSDAPAFIRADLGSSKSVCAVRVAGGDIPVWGNVADYLNGADIQYQSGSDWITVATVSGVVDNVGLGEVERTFSFPPASARYWRLVIFGAYLATTEFRLYGVAE